MSYIAAADPFVRYAEQEILDVHGDSVSVADRKKSFQINGRGTNIGTATTGFTIWSTSSDNAHETYIAANTNSIDSISSSSASDTSKQVTIEGFTESAGAKTFVSQTATLDATNSQTRVALATGLNRVTRMFGSGSSNLVGNIFVYPNTTISAGKPTTVSTIKCTIPAGRNESAKGATTMANTEYGILTHVWASMAAASSVAFTEFHLQIRENTKVFRGRLIFQAKAGDTVWLSLRPYIIVPKNADIRIMGIASASAQTASAGFGGYLASVI